MRTKIRKILQGRKNVQTAPNSFLIKQCNILSQSNVLLEFLGMRKDKNTNISIIYKRSSKKSTLVFKAFKETLKILVLRSILTSTDYFVLPSVITVSSESLLFAHRSSEHTSEIRVYCLQYAPQVSAICISGLPNEFKTDASPLLLI